MTSRPVRPEYQEDKRRIVKRRHLLFHATRWTTPPRMMRLDNQHRFSFNAEIRNVLSAAGFHRHCEKKNITIKMFCLPLTQMRDRDTDIVRRMESTKPSRVVVIGSDQRQATCKCMLGGLQCRKKYHLLNNRPSRGTVVLSMKPLGSVTFVRTQLG